MTNNGANQTVAGEEAGNRLTRAWALIPANSRGVLWIMLGTVAFACNDVVIKHLGRNIPTVELALFRYLIGFMLLLPAFVHMGREGLKTKRPGIHLLRLVFACIGQLGVFYAVIHLLLADATAISFSRPLFTTVIAVFLIGEAVGWRRWVATAIGFIGVVVMVRPGQAGFDMVAVIAVISAAIFAFANVLIRRMSTTEPPNRILFYYHLGGILVFTGPATWLWVMPTGYQWPLLFTIGVLTTVGMIGFVRAFSCAEASIVGPIEYTRLIYAALFGYYIFAEIPDIWSGVGALIIIVSTVYIARREAQVGKTDQKQPL